MSVSDYNQTLKTKNENSFSIHKKNVKGGCLDLVSYSRIHPGIKMPKNESKRKKRKQDMKEIYSSVLPILE